MQALTELVPPTAVTHAAKLPFLSARAQNLIVAKSCLLQIYESTQVRLPESLEPSTARGHAKLVLLAEYPLSGIVTSLAAVKILNSKSGGDALLISFKDAKISLVEWDPEIYSLSTISIHYYESDDLQGSSWAPDLRHCSSFLTADPSSRCAALKFGLRHLAVLPFRQTGDDLNIGGYDPDLDGPLQTQKIQPATNGDSEGNDTPYGASFVLPLTALDPNLIHPVDLAFLYEYREPTLGVLGSSKNPSASLVQERKDILTYSAFTLDLEQRARTLLLSVSGLPSDLFKLAPLPLPVGGSLLIGGNEVVHVDQSGKTNAVAVNEFARLASSFPMTDQSDLALKLEGCVVEQLNSSNGDMLVILSTGELVVISFRLDGRSVSGLSLKPVLTTRGGAIVGSAASCAVALTEDLVFVGSEGADSLLLRCNRRAPTLSRKRSHADMLGDDEDNWDQEEEDEDDLYAETPKSQRPREFSMSTGTTDDLSFQVDDRLPNIAANAEPCYTRRKPMTSHTQEDANITQSTEHFEIAIATGRNTAGSLTFLSKRMHFQTLHQVPMLPFSQTWCLATRESEFDAAQKADQPDGVTDLGYDQYIVGTLNTETENPTSRIYNWSAGELKEVAAQDFDSEVATIAAGVLCDGKRVVQVSPSEVRSLESDLSLAQLIPMLDDTENELSITHTSFADPYLLVCRDDSSVILLKADEKGDQLEEVERGDVIGATKWSAGCLYSEVSNGQKLAFLLSVDGILNVFELPKFDKPSVIFEGCNSMPLALNPDTTARRSPNREAITEILVATLGDASSQIPYLMLRTAGNGLAVYSICRSPSQGTGTSFLENLRWTKVLDTSLIKQQGDDESPSSSIKSNAMRYTSNLGGYSAIIVPSNRPSLIIKDAISMPRIIEVADENIGQLSAIHVTNCNHGLLAPSSEGIATLLQLPKDALFGFTGWATRQKLIGQEVDAICYHAPSNLYVVGINQPADFKLPEDDWHQEWAKEDLSLKPTGNLAKIQIFDPKIWEIIGEITLEQDEIITCAMSLDLEISEITHERKPLIAIGTAIVKGEDLPANGSIYVFDVVEVVPHPERPETNRSLKQLVREEVKGAVTALSEIGTEGFLLASQGQKCMVRGLKEDNSLLPVAFLDVQCHVTVLRNLKGTGLCLIGDAIKGIWVFGYSRQNAKFDPYRMRLFSKTRSKMEVVAAELLPSDKQLFMLSADMDCNVHVLEFNPEDPKSLSGQRLLNRSVFHTGHYPVSMGLIPVSSDRQSTVDNIDDTESDDGKEELSIPQSILMTTLSGALCIITPLEEEAYRRLGALQAHLTGILEQPCGLNPRAFRAVESEGFGSRGILDGQVLKRWHLLSAQRKVEACARGGSNVWEINRDLAIMAGLGQL